MELKIKTAKYGKTHIFSLNNYNFHWKEITKFKDLETILLANKYQRNINYNQTNIKQPSIVLNNNENFSADDVFFDKTVLLMNICLPCYDEEWCEISGTLRSLSKNILVHRNRPDNSFQLHVNIYLIQDGWNKASKSLKEGLVKEWGCPSKEMIDKSLSNDVISILIPEHEIFYPCYQHFNDDDKSSGVTFHPIFITKKRNAQKYNSHLLFFSLCNLQNPDFVFLTDCGTVFDSDCIFQLTEYLYKKHSNIIGVTAKQSVMNETTRREIQEYPYWWKNKKRESFCSRFMKQIYWWFSPAPLQGFEFESSFLLNTSMFNIAGALPVLPGPCQMLWWDHLKKDSGQSSNGVLDVYFKHINDSVKESSNIIKINTVLAEDRILSFAMILRTFDLKTVWVNKATFSYEPMMTWVQLLGQRRRWINGTVSTFLYYLFDEKGKDEYSMSGLGNRKSIKCLWFIQLYQSLLQIFSPSFFSIAVFESFSQFFKMNPNMRNVMRLFRYNNRVFNLSQEIIFSGFYLCFYIIWVIISFLFGKKSECCSKTCYNFFMEIIYSIFSIVNGVISIFIFYNIFSTNDKMLLFGPLIYILMFIWIIPFFLSLSLSFNSAFYYILYSLPFFVNICQYVTFVPAFAFARLHDLSWGNRDSKTNISKKKKNSFAFTTFKLNFLVILSNVFITMLYIYLITVFGHNEYIYSVFFLILFSSVIIQILFTILYFCKIIFKGCRRQFCCLKNDDFEVSSDKIPTVIKTNSNSSAII